MEIKLLKPEQWHLIEHIVKGEFGNAMPDNEESDFFLAAIDGEKIAGFVHVEKVFHLNCIYVDKEHRHSRIALCMMHETDNLLSNHAKGFSAIALSEHPIIEKLFQRQFQARDLGLNRVFRKDY